MKLDFRTSFTYHSPGPCIYKEVSGFFLLLLVNGILRVYSFDRSNSSSAINGGGVGCRRRGRESQYVMVSLRKYLEYTENQVCAAVV